jgi:hypothetical protein
MHYAQKCLNQGRVNFTSFLMCLPNNGQRFDKTTYILPQQR